MIEAGLAIALLVGLLLLGVPMVASLLTAIIVNFMLTGAWLSSLPQMLTSGMSRFILIALPMFILAGGLMNAGGISSRLFDFARAIVGSLRGGLAQVNVLTSMFFGGMIGSSTADLAGTGSVIIPQMKKEGYPPEFAAAVSASSSGVGPMIPPSSPMILYSAVTGTSLGALFLAGLIPGILLGLCMMGLVSFLARRRGWKQIAPFSWAEIRRTGKRAALSFGLPIIIVGGLVAGVFTPTEASAFAVAYAILLSCFIYREIGPRDLFRIMANSVQMTGELLLIVSLSFAFGWALTSMRVPEAIAIGIDSLILVDSQFLRLLSLMLLAIIAGMILDPLIPVLLPVILPTLIAYQIDLTQFGVLMVIAVVIGQLTPPLAIALIITGKIAKVDQLKVFHANWPFLLLIIAFMFLIMVVPQLATWLPDLMRN
jgi:tripartite ATP-independent transporter DctM subunit